MTYTVTSSAYVFPDFEADYFSISTGGTLTLWKRDKRPGFISGPRDECVAAFAHGVWESIVSRD